MLVADLVNLDSAPWSEWRGIKDDQQPRKLSEHTLAALLKPFQIRPKKHRPSYRDPIRGYFRSDFEPAWRAYCDRAGTPEHSRNIRYLHSR